MPTSLPTILLVDDDETTRVSSRRYLRQLHASGEILEAADGAEALALVQAHCQRNCDQRLLVLLDLNMPVMDGLAFLEHQVQLPQVCQQVTSVIVVSASPDAQEQAQARQLAVALVPKPLSREQLAEVLHQYLPEALPVGTPGA